MTKEQFLNMLSEQEVYSKSIERIEAKYDAHFPDAVMRIISCAKESIFVDNGYRILSNEEVLLAEQELHVAFKEKGILPLVDCGENDFIVFHYKDGFWSKFNITDEAVFKKKKAFEEYFV